MTAEIKKYITLGVNETTEKNEVKKIQLLHIFCNTWHLFSILSVIEDLIRARLTLFIGFCYIFMILSVITVQILLYKQKTAIAGLVFVTNIFFTVLFFCNFIYTAELLEYYFLLPPSIILIYSNNKSLNIAILILCLLALFLPNLYFRHYPISVINNMNPSFLFFSLFIVISYFKNLNLKNEKILEAKTRELEELDKFKSQFFTNISHEIRTPLTLVNGYISELDDITNIDNSKDIQTNVKKQINKITGIVDSVLDLAKMQSSNFMLQLKATNISELIRRIEMNFEPLFQQKKVELEITNTTTDYFSLIDTVFLEKAFSNLITNALKYTEKGKISIKCYDKKDLLVIKISDTGIGIAHQDINRVFNRFYQVNNDINATGGSGIGLAFCKEIIELHDGSISLKSELNQGSEFTIKLPLYKVQSVDINAKEKIIVSNKMVVQKNKINLNSITSRNFLIVEDNFEMRKYLVSILKGNNCFETSNPLEALQILEDKKIDLIITDYMMPKLNGFEFVKQLKKRENTIPIIMLTAKTDKSSKLKVLHLGVDDYITKPFHKEELLSRIKFCLKNNLTRQSFNQNKTVKINTNKENPFIEDLKVYIFDNSNITSLNQDTIAYHFNISKSSFYRKVKSNTGLSPNNFIKEIRLLKARNILQQKPDTSLKELAATVGFSHSSYFSKVYENRFGVKPTSNP